MECLVGLSSDVISVALKQQQKKKRFISSRLNPSGQNGG